MYRFSRPARRANTPTMFRSRRAQALRALSFTGALVLSFGAMPWTSGRAGALGTVHTLNLRNTPTTNQTPPYGTAVEGEARAKFTCNDANGEWGLKITNVQVFQPDHVTPWDTTKLGGYWIEAYAYSAPGTIVAIAQISQNTTNGLFGLAVRGKFTAAELTAGACATGRSYVIYDSNSPALALWMTGTLP